jgi:ABC-type glycerol-3-phosphate transport system substrate-binding protein
MLQRLQACRLAGSSATPEDAFRDGQAMLCLTDASWVVSFQKSPALRNKFGICPIPGGASYFDYRTGQKTPAPPEGNRLPYLGSRGRLAVVSRESPHATAAFALLAELSGPEVSGQIACDPLTGGGPLREEHLNRERWDAYDLDHARTDALREALKQALQHRSIKNPVLCLRIPDQAAHRDALVAELRPALTDKRDAVQALTAVRQRWLELDRAQGLEAHKTAYRLSLGLLAR